ncbi:MAG: hypothetical protein ACKOZM_11235 [Flavobacteriales bacterium]
MRWWLGSHLDLDGAKTAGVFINILFILLIVFLGINLQYKIKQKEKTAFVEDVKACMKPALIYVLAALGSMAVYYTFIGSDIELLRSARITKFTEEIQDETYFQNYLSQNPERAGKSKDALVQDYRNEVESFVSLKTLLIFGSVALVIISFVYSVLAVFFWRNFLRKW